MTRPLKTETANKLALAAYLRTVVCAMTRGVNYFTGKALLAKIRLIY